MRQGGLVDGTATFAMIMSFSFTRWTRIAVWVILPNAYQTHVLTAFYIHNSLYSFLWKTYNLRSYPVLILVVCFLVFCLILTKASWKSPCSLSLWIPQPSSLPRKHINVRKCKLSLVQVIGMFTSQCFGLRGTVNKCSLIKCIFRCGQWINCFLQIE